MAALTQKRAPALPHQEPRPGGAQSKPGLTPTLSFRLARKGHPDWRPEAYSDVQGWPWIPLTLEEGPRGQRRAPVLGKGGPCWAQGWRGRALDLRGPSGLRTVGGVASGPDLPGWAPAAHRLAPCLSSSSSSFPMPRGSRARAHLGSPACSPQGK